MKNKNNPVDAQGTTQEQAVEMLRNLLKNGFSADVEKLALALGRESDEITGILSGKDIIDDDLAMKIQNIARERNIEVE